MKTKFRRTFKIILISLCTVATCAAAIVVPERKLSGVPLYQFLTQTPSPDPAPEENLEEVPLYSQPTGETCGEAAFVMAWDYAHPTQTLNLNDVIVKAIEQGWYIPGDPAGVYTSPDHMRDMAAYYAALHGTSSPETGQVNNSQHGLLFLFSNIILGRPVIVDVNTIMGDTSSTAHFVVVTGVSLLDGEISYNDPYGYISPYERQAGQRRAQWDVFWNSWSNNGDDNGKGNGWYMVVR